MDDLDGGTDDDLGYKSLTHGPSPALLQAENAKGEADHILELISSLRKESPDLSGACLTARTNSLVTHYESILSQAGIEVYRIPTNSPHDQSRPGIRLGTMHRIKGIEFDYIIIASANAGVIPSSKHIKDGGHVLTEREIETKERSLLYVALTRARKLAYLSCFGTPSPFIQFA